jgi:hypothetical protein
MRVHKEKEGMGVRIHERQQRVIALGGNRVSQSAHGGSRVCELAKLGEVKRRRPT